MVVIGIYKAVNRIFQLIQFVGEFLDNDQSVQFAPIENNIFLVYVCGHFGRFYPYPFRIDNGGSFPDHHFGRLYDSR